MENFSGIGPEATNRKTIREPRKHRPRRNQRGTKRMATAAESRKKSRPREGSKAGTSAAERRCDHRRDRQSDWLAKPHHPGVPQRACCEEDGARASSPLRMRTASGFTGSFPRTTVETTAS